MVKSIAELINSINTIIITIFTIVTALFWYGVTQGSWQNNENGCIEFDIRPTIQGQIYAPGGVTITKYKGGFTILNWASFEFITEVNGELNWGGIATGWINPFNRTLNLTYKNQTLNGKLKSGYVEKKGIVFTHRTESCLR